MASVMLVRGDMSSSLAARAAKALPMFAADPVLNKPPHPRDRPARMANTPLARRSICTSTAASRRTQARQVFGTRPAAPPHVLDGLGRLPMLLGHPIPGDGLECAGGTPNRVERGAGHVKPPAQGEETLRTIVIWEVRHGGSDEKGATEFETSRDDCRLNCEQLVNLVDCERRQEGGKRVGEGAKHDRNRPSPIPTVLSPAQSHEVGQEVGVPDYTAE
eukprot:CAMPEP_0198577408 /NCGR_PEP_ID=MMETSP1462-20131121/118857_1 /TAXON_ID=1333877 /ORGANISM="Brandtodinium nutriculum, Strain RCC3387" /LENGTH=217 /DNA_ID=CAMNT_0044308691 /DNA_START=75 /DNA_END=727 /DNA_ORIENTATION=+